MIRIMLKIAAAFVVVVLLLMGAAIYVAERAMEEEQSLAASGDIRGALAASGTAARYNPFDSEPYIAEASLLQNVGRSGDALRVLEEAIRREPENYIAHLSAGNIKSSQEEYGEAEKNYRAAYEINPRSSASSEGLAQVLLRQGDLQGSRKFYEDLRERRKIDNLGLYDLGRIYVRTGDPEEGYRLISQARRKTEEELQGFEGAAQQGQLALIENMQLSAADALVAQEDYNAAYRLLERSGSDQAPGLLQLIATDPEGYRESVINSEIY